jgi:hypothetical protein
MRTSLIETERIEAHLLQLSNPGDALVFEAKLLLDDELSDKLYWQKSTYNMVKQYGRNQLKKEIEAVHQTLFREATHKSFSEKIRQIFSKR